MLTAQNRISPNAFALLRERLELFPITAPRSNASLCLMAAKWVTLASVALLYRPAFAYFWGQSAVVRVNARYVVLEAFFESSAVSRKSFRHQLLRWFCPLPSVALCNCLRF